MSLRKLPISGFFVLISRITTPSLAHLFLENMISCSSCTTEQSILDVLRRCSQLETVLVNILSGQSHTLQSSRCTPVTLPKLRNIELGYGEFEVGPILLLRFPSTVAAGFRDIAEPRPPPYK